MGAHWIGNGPRGRTCGENRVVLASRCGAAAPGASPAAHPAQYLSDRAPCASCCCIPRGERARDVERVEQERSAKETKAHAFRRLCVALRAARSPLVSLLLLLVRPQPSPCSSGAHVSLRVKSRWAMLAGGRAGAVGTAKPSWQCSSVAPPPARRRRCVLVLLAQQSSTVMVVESPTKASKIAQYLGRGYTVRGPPPHPERPVRGSTHARRRTPEGRCRASLPASQPHSGAAEHRSIAPQSSTPRSTRGGGPYNLPPPPPRPAGDCQLRAHPRPGQQAGRRAARPGVRHDVGVHAGLGAEVPRH